MVLIRIDTILSKNIDNNFLNLLLEKLLDQSGNQTHISEILLTRRHTLVAKNRQVSVASLVHIVRIVVSMLPDPPPLQKHHPLFFVKLPLQSANCPSPPFLDSFLLYIGFSGPTPLKIRFLDEPPNIFKFFIFNSIPSFKSN